MIKNFFTSVLIVGGSLLLISWGGTGHRKISANASLSFNSEMSMFYTWTDYLRDHASDADDRKSTDNTEAPKHYIDLDNYSEFLTTGKIYQDSYNNTSNGILPWATIATFESLKNCLKIQDWENAKRYAADLGHYVGDGHMPLHLTKNYDGQYTGNSGVHSRYESNMIGSFNSQITYTGESINVITDVKQYIFNYIYSNFKYKDSILKADTYAQTLGSTTSDAYKQALWNKSRVVTIKLFKDASHALAELIYTAWVQSQSTADDQNQNILPSEYLEQNSPNPFTTHTSIRYNLTESSDVTLQVKDVLGNTVAMLFKGYQAIGSYSVEWYPLNQHDGIYFIVMDTKKIHRVKKMILSSGV